MVDKRILKTKASIKKAFMELSLEKENEKISISDIAARAQINRSTFYLHYAEASEVIEDIENELAQKISECIEGFDVADIYGSTYTMFTGLTDIFNENEALKNYIISPKDSNRITSRLKDILVEKTTAAVLKIIPDIDEKDFMYSLTFAAAGIVDCFLKRARSGGKKPLEELIAEVSRHTENVIKSINQD